MTGVDPTVAVAPTMSARRADMNDLIFVSMEDWDEIWRRNQFVCAELARRHPERKILFVGLPVDVSNRLRRGRLGELTGRGTRAVEGLPNVVVTHPWKWWPNSVGVGRRVNEAGFRRHVRKVAAGMGLREPVLWLNPHYAVHMAGRMGERGVVYDITDDWTTISQSEPLRELVRRQDAALCGRADATIVCSRRLYELKRGMCRNLHLIPNGVDAEHYRQVLDGPARGEGEAEWGGGGIAGRERGAGEQGGKGTEGEGEWERPVLGYTGTVHPDRVDVGLVEALARRMGRGTVVMIGPDMLSVDDRARLLGTGRVVLAGPQQYRRLPEHMRKFDVCITPHRVTAFTESLNPIKLWEYLAAGKPIVSTDVAGFRDYPDLVYLASSPEEFLGAVGRALTEDPTQPAARRREAERHSWQSRVDQIEAVIEGCHGSARRVPEKRGEFLHAH